jgi:hypothetical protein
VTNPPPVSTTAATMRIRTMKKTTTAPAINVTSEFTAPRGAYAIVGNSNNLEDQMNMRIGQLKAMLAMTYGEPGESFRRMNAEIQDNYLWACTTMVDLHGIPGSRDASAGVISWPLIETFLQHVRRRICTSTFVHSQLPGS